MPALRHLVSNLQAAPRFARVSLLLALIHVPFVPLAAQSVGTVFIGPAGNQNLTLLGSEVWTVFEYGARYYQKRTNPAPWDDLYPFLFRVIP